MGLLADAFSYGNGLKRKVNGLLSDPVGTLELGVTRLGEDQNKLLGLLVDVMPAGRTAAPEVRQNALRQLADYGSQVGMAGMINKGDLAAKYPDVIFDLMQRGDKATLSRVVVPKEMRNQGVGSNFMRDLTAAADADGATLALSPSSDFGGSKTRLVQFYKDFGFVPNKGRAKDFEISESMLRLPK